MISTHDDGSPYRADHLRFLLDRAALAGQRHRASVAHLLDMSSTDAAALACLAQNGGLTSRQLGTMLSLTSGGVTALTQRLESAGHVVRRPHPTDRRSTVLSASPAILDRAAACSAALVVDLDLLARRLSSDERQIIGDYLADAVKLSERHAEELARAAERAEREPLGDAHIPGMWA